MNSAILEIEGGGVLEVLEGDLTLLDVDAIVNAANSALQLGAGVAGAIRKRGGPSIQRECDRIGFCPVGGAVLTGAGELRARHVVHAVGPVWGRQAEAESDRLLASACRRSLEVANGAELRDVAFPALSTGVFGFPMDRAARVLLETAAEHLRGERSSVRRVVFCLFGIEAYEVFREALDRIAKES